MWLSPSDWTTRTTLIYSKGKSNLPWKHHRISHEKSCCATDDVCQPSTGATDSSPKSSNLLSQHFWPRHDPNTTKQNLFWFCIGFSSVSNTHLEYSNFGIFIRCFLFLFIPLFIYHNNSCFFSFGCFLFFFFF